ncbi:MAG: sulfatase-like hydrolase/transferase, partial [Phycisphaerales bacterium]|nr:sulfatase-like hydrolase/transferase [Phycisphaerales bacterium]
MQTAELLPAQHRQHRAGQLRQFLLLSYGATLLNTFGYLRSASFAGIAATLYTIAVYLSYSFAYLLPAATIIVAIDFIFRPVPADGRRRRLSNVWRTRIVFGAAILLTTCTQIVIFADRTTFTIFGMHLNGFVWNTVFTPGGLESMGESSSASLVYGLIFSGYFVVQVFFALVVRKVTAFDRLWRRFVPRRSVLATTVLMVLCFVGGSIGYGVSDIRSYSPVLISASAFPLYQPITFRHLARKMGFEVDARDEIRVSAADGRLNYPLKPIDLQPPPHPMNIVWLVAESLRADMLDPEIMPATWRFAQRAHRFTRHYSGGNGTRMGMFAMFYGLYGNLWFTFLREHHGPVLIDVLQQLGYQMKMFTSARFTYPEFDRTIFAKLPGDQLHEEWGGPGWDRDRRNVEQILDFLRAQTPDRPFMTFMFFESPHARYYFPDESIIRTSYLEDFNYATMDLDRDMPLIKNRYINACHHLDSQIARITDYLEQQNQHDSTIVLI